MNNNVALVDKDTTVVFEEIVLMRFWNEISLADKTGQRDVLDSTQEELDQVRE